MSYHSEKHARTIFTGEEVSTAIGEDGKAVPVDRVMIDDGAIREAAERLDSSDHEEE